MKIYPVKFKPIPQERIWGGHQLKEWFGVKDKHPIGEYWVLSGHPHGLSVVSDGPLVGKTLQELIDMAPEAYLGQSPQPRFPLLIKFLEATSDLSVQIHPDDTYAQRVEGDYGKTEAWYILHTKPDGKVIYGHTFPDREAYFQAIREQQVHKYLNYKPIKKGDVVFVPSRTLHALLGGTIVLEIQQTSDITYRVYDWDRVDEQGRGRTLHVDKAADVMQYGQDVHRESGQVEIKTVFVDERITHHRLVSCSYFTMEKIELTAGEYTLTTGKTSNPDILIVVDGEGNLETGDMTMPLKRTDTVLVPAQLSAYRLKTTKRFTLIRAFY
ncbi:mannose-6-phosphate isomerase [Caldalkalibacillus uzonensis]|uniref:Mannose-6-phosphate isomerase n=1 Tax=Caldalkalibacillus uzonensis TaxID=353224 RepID=A0ABU0CUH6_9BACI|nr:type I phosphomannose isomerase catalytic subunit [Caldalkalibacillus uzonensis]MDQ0338672.1 mannose-6-phosphate isomerase [Caldalkalibacillus uzonensis]